MEEIARGSHRFEAELFVAYTGWGYASGIFYNKVRFLMLFKRFRVIPRRCLV